MMLTFDMWNSWNVIFRGRVSGSGLIMADVDSSTSQQAQHYDNTNTWETIEVTGPSEKRRVAIIKRSDGKATRIRYNLNVGNRTFANLPLSGDFAAVINDNNTSQISYVHAALFIDRYITDQEELLLLNWSARRAGITL